jgi:hypothetical protein
MTRTSSSAPFCCQAPATRRVAEARAASDTESLTSTRNTVAMRRVSTLRTRRETLSASSAMNPMRNIAESSRCCHGKSASDL